MNEMHWRIGQLLYERKLEKAHGASVVKHLSVDLKNRYPDMGMSERNLWDMKRFYVRFRQSSPKLRQAVVVLRSFLLLSRICRFSLSGIYKARTKLI